MMDSFYQSNGACHPRDQIKVVFIKTQYINTDVVNFKSVVQRLTSRGSSYQPQDYLDYLPPPSTVDTPTLSVASELLDGLWSVATPNGDANVLEKLSSFKDFEMMISQL